MKYITHHRFKSKALCGEVLNLPYGTELTLKDDTLFTLGGKAVCCVTSENAKMYFARNDDKDGLERGKYEEFCKRMAEEDNRQKSLRR